MFAPVEGKEGGFRNFVFVKYRKKELYVRRILTHSVVNTEGNLAET
jgi:mRNA-degrading endonuclease HigB of HigAB toxin-antitoxin module